MRELQARRTSKTSERAQGPPSDPVGGTAAPGTERDVRQLAGALARSGIKTHVAIVIFLSWPFERWLGDVLGDKRLHSFLMRVRPTQVADLLKLVLGVRRAVVRSKTGHRFFVDPVSNLGMHLQSNDGYEPTMTALVVTLLRPSDVFIDVGANEGYFSVVAASRVGDWGVHAFEPQTRLQETIRINCELNSAKVATHHCALSSESGYVDLYLRPSTNTGASSMFRHWRLGSKMERVPCVTLDSFFEAHSILKARLIKIDCEGAEALVVEGGWAILTEHRAEFIALEYHPKICGRDKCREIHKCLTGLGYMLSAVSGLHIYHLPSLENELAHLGEFSANSWVA